MGAIAEELARTVERIQRGVDKAFAFVDLLEDPASLHRQLPDNVRREMLAALFSRLDVRVTDRDVSVDPERAEINAVLHDWQAQHRLAAQTHVAEKRRELPVIPRKALFQTHTGLLDPKV